MKRLLTMFAFVALFSLPKHHAAAQAASAPPPELNKIGYLVGTWNVEATGYSPNGGPATKVALTFDNAWMPGRYFLVMRSTYKDGTTGVAYMGYDKDAGVYTYDEYESTGYTDHSKGVFEGDTWKWTSGNHGTSAGKDRFTMKLLSPTSYSFKFESSEDGSSWKTTMDGVGHKSQ